MIPCTRQVQIFNPKNRIKLLFLLIYSWVREWRGGQTSQPRTAQDSGLHWESKAWRVINSSGFYKIDTEYLEISAPESVSTDIQQALKSDFRIKWVIGAVSVTSREPRLDEKMNAPDLRLNNCESHAEIASH